MKILVIGESCLDIFNYGTCERLAPEVPVPIFKPGFAVENMGMAGNVKNNLVALGADAVLHTNQNWREITKTRFMDNNTNHMFMRLDVNDAAFGRVNVKDINFDNYHAVIISDYNKGFLKEKDIKYIALRHKLVFLDSKKAIGTWCRNITFIKINNHEFKKAKNRIAKSILDKLIITLGPDGASFRNTVYPVPLVILKNAAGSGDTFIGCAVE